MGETADGRVEGALRPRKARRPRHSRARRLRKQQKRRRSSARPPGRPHLPGGPITVPEPTIAIATLSCPGGTGAEPGAEFTVPGTLTTVLVSDPSVTVTCDGLVYPANVTADGSSFTVQVRAY